MTTVQAGQPGELPDYLSSSTTLYSRRVRPTLSPISLLHIGRELPASNRRCLKIGNEGRQAGPLSVP